LKISLYLKERIRCVFSTHHSIPSLDSDSNALESFVPSFFCHEDALMFTGLVEEVGECLSLRKAADAIRLTLIAPEISPELHIGESVAVNGACLTVTSRTEANLSFDLLEETFLRTNLSDLHPGSKINLERALRADGRLGGHFVQGHVDCTAKVIAYEERKGDLRLDFELPHPFAHYLAWKGSICINGVSLTVAELTGQSFAVWLIPHTRRATNLGDLVVGSEVNLEFDILAKYAERILAKAP
jgi:riboflavin synthase